MGWRDTVTANGAVAAKSWRDTVQEDAPSLPGQKTGPAQTALEQYGNMLSFGHLPQLQAAAEKVTTPIFNMLPGQDVESGNYVEERDANIKRMARGEAENPNAAMVGKAAGLLNSAAIMPGAGGKGLAALSKFVGAGAAQGALQNPGDVEGEVSPLQPGLRAENAGSGAVIGGLTGGASRLVSGAANKLRGSAVAANKAAEGQAVKATGAMLKDLRVLDGKRQTKNLGRWLLDKGVVKAGDTFDDIAAKAEKTVQQSGKQLEKIYSTAAQKAQANIDKITPSAAQELAEKWATSGFNPVRDREKILKEVAKAVGDEVEGSAAIEKVSRYLDELAAKHGDKTLGAKMANDIKSAMDRRINYARNPLTKEPNVDSAFKAARTVVSKGIDEEIDILGKAAGTKGLLKKLKTANKDYGFGKQTTQMAKDKATRESANQAMSLGDRVAAGGGAVVGTGAGLLSGDRETATGLGLAGAVGAGLLNRTNRRYGAGVLAGGLNRAAPILKKTAVPMGKKIRSAMDTGLPSGLLMRGQTSGLTGDE